MTLSFNIPGFPTPITFGETSECIHLSNIPLHAQALLNEIIDDDRCYQVHYASFGDSLGVLLPSCNLHSCKFGEYKVTVQEARYARLNSMIHIKTASALEAFREKLASLKHTVAIVFCDALYNSWGESVTLSDHFFGMLHEIQISNPTVTYHFVLVTGALRIRGVGHILNTWKAKSYVAEGEPVPCVSGNCTVVNDFDFEEEMPVPFWQEDKDPTYCRVPETEYSTECFISYPDSIPIGIQHDPYDVPRVIAVPMARGGKSVHISLGNWVLDDMGKMFHHQGIKADYYSKVFLDSHPYFTVKDGAKQFDTLEEVHKELSNRLHAKPECVVLIGVPWKTLLHASGDHTLMRTIQQLILDAALTGTQFVFVSDYIEAIPEIISLCSVKLTDANSSCYRAVLLGTSSEDVCTAEPDGCAMLMVSGEVSRVYIPTQDY